jgi:thioredoxin reductase
MAVDTPARIAVLGAGAIGLEAALYARYLGYDVDLYERGDVAENVLRWGHVRLFTPWSQNVSPLALAALAAQDESWRPPAADCVLTGRQFAEQYLLPLAHSDLLVDGLHTRTEVVAVARPRQLKYDNVGVQAREDDDFRLLLRDDSGKESIATADVVIDASGTFGNHNWAGRSGIPSLGELAASEQIEYGLADILDRDRAKYAGKKVLLVGAGYSAATSVVSLAELAAAELCTEVVWITRKSPVGAAGPIPMIDADRLAERDRLARAANDLANGASNAVDYRPGRMVEAIEHTPNNRLLVRLSIEVDSGAPGEEIEVDRIIANVGYQGDNSIYRELQVHECYASGGPMKLAAALAGNKSADCLRQTSYGPQSLVTSEPDFYILGAKSYGRNSQFLLSIGHQQVRDLFTIIADRADLDLYQTIG